MIQNNELIFISIASYRDSQLVATIEDLLAKADEPGLLRFGICWQHGPEETAFPFQADERFRVLDVPWQQSRGVCWARAETMKLWQGEQWFLQTDSHCRFPYRWDTRLIRMMAQTESEKPILSTYGNVFSPGSPEDERRDDLGGPPQKIALAAFAPDGLPLLKPLPILDHAARTRPMAARFLAAGFLFAPGSFVEEVPYDPDLYFIGEEISMSLRAYTSGYDLFHPVETMSWHDYVRSYAIRHWDDHDPASASPDTRAWGTLDLQSRARVRHLLDPPSGWNETLGSTQSTDSVGLGSFDLGSFGLGSFGLGSFGLGSFGLGSFGLGSVRTLEEYEAYAGVSLRLRKMQDYTRRAAEPPNPPAPADWPDRIYTWLVRIAVDAVDLSALAFDECGFWMMAVLDQDRHEILRRDLGKKELPACAGEEPQVILVAEIESGIIPASWVVWPFSQERGWGRRLEGYFSPSDFSIVSDDLDGDPSS